MNTLMIFTVIAAASAAPALAGDRAATSSETVVKHITVNFSDLDISRVAGADALIQRIRKASQKACGARPAAADIPAYARHQACIVEATDQAVKQVNAPLVTARYARDPGQPRLAAK